MVTVFTPSYDRAYILPELYKSLVSQTYRNFEWIIVDDGSSDNTESLVSEWKNKSDFNILYIKSLARGGEA